MDGLWLASCLNAISNKCKPQVFYHRFFYLVYSNLTLLKSFPTGKLLERLKDKSLRLTTLTVLLYSILILKCEGQNYAWAKDIGGILVEEGKSVTVDTQNNIYITGRYNGSVDFDPGPGLQYLSSSIDDIFIAKYDQNGNYLWAKRIGGPKDDIGETIIFDPSSGFLYLFGRFGGSVDFDPGPAEHILVSDGSTDVFFAKYDIDGNYIWANKLGGSTYTNNFQIDSEGNCYLTGWVSGTVDFDPGPGVQYLTAPIGFPDFFIAKYNSSGNYIWAENIGGPDSSVDGLDIAIDEIENVYVTGRFTHTGDFDPGPNSHLLTAAGSGVSAFFAKYDSSGNYIWAKSIESSSVGDQIIVDKSGMVYIAGRFSDTADFDPGPQTFNLVSSGNNDIFLAKYTTDGNLLFAKKIGGIGNESVNFLKGDNLGNVYLTGKFFGTVDFDPSLLVHNLTNPGTSQATYIARYDDLGNYKWAYALGNSEQTTCNSIGVGMSGNNIYLIGGIYGTIDFDFGMSTHNLQSAGAIDMFIAKYYYQFVAQSEILSDRNFTVYPNPTDRYLIIKGDSLLNGDYIITLTNISGQFICMNKIAVSRESFQADLNIKDLPSGIYILHVNTKNKSGVFKILKL